MKWFILVSLVFSLLLPISASARLHIPLIGGEFPECDPSQGEPPSWCGNWPEEGNGFSVFMRKLRYEVDQALGAIFWR